METPTHPVTGKPLTEDERDIPDVAGTIVRAVHDNKGRLVFVYDDGHLLTREVERGEIVWRTLYPSTPMPLRITADMLTKVD